MGVLKTQTSKPQTADLENAHLEKQTSKTGDLGSRKQTVRKRTGNNSVTKLHVNNFRYFTVLFKFSQSERYDKLPEIIPTTISHIGPGENNFSVPINCTHTGKFHHYKNFERIFKTAVGSKFLSTRLSNFWWIPSQSLKLGCLPFVVIHKMIDLT